MKKLLGMIIIACLVWASLPGIALACSANAQTCSTDFQVNEAFFGSGGQLDAQSANYQAKQSAGELTVGNTQSANFQAQGGFNTDRTPYIQMDVSNTNIDLGTLTATATKTANATFTVEAYLAHGYSVVNASGPPTNNAYTMAAISSPTASSAGTEQFGINLTANTLPTTFGAIPVQVPSSSFAYGVVANNYSIPNEYMYGVGDTIASSPSSTSDTIYTISYIFNVSRVTPGGTYVLHDVLVATGTY